MTNKLQLITILTLATVLITGGFGLTPFAYSTNDHDDKDNKWKQADKDNKWKLNYDEHDDDDCKDDDDDDCKDDDDGENDSKPKTATITLYKAITTDNKLAPTTDPNFELKITNATKMIDVPSGSTIIVDAGTYQMSETEKDGYKFVLIAGDTQCPSRLDTPFIVKGGDKIECTVYNEDKFVEGQTGGSLDGPGVIFHYDTISMVPNDILDDNHCNVVGAELPCIQKEGSGSKYMIFPDFATDNSLNTLTQTSLILLTVLDTTNPLLTGDCRVTGVQELSQSFVAVCPGFDLDNESDSFNFNWAIIETST